VAAPVSLYSDCQVRPSDASLPASAALLNRQRFPQQQKAGKVSTAIMSGVEMQDKLQRIRLWTLLIRQRMPGSAPGNSMAAAWSENLDAI
jgi:hypothetical protein